MQYSYIGYDNLRRYVDAFLKGLIPIEKLREKFELEIGDTKLKSLSNVTFAKLIRNKSITVFGADYYHP